jgi:Phasin protein
MKHSVHTQASNPMDVYGVLGMQVPPFDFAEKAYRAWLDGAQTVQAEATEFVSARASKDMAALSEWARCKTPTDALEMQARYASEALSDYVVGSQRMFRLLSAAGQRGDEAAK